jgi:hypothetical protein
MKHIRLIAASDEYDTSLGFVLKGCASFDGLMCDRDGTLTAHDVLEHCNGIANMGPVWDELEALGGGWYVRGQWGDMMQYRPNIHSPTTNFASDVTRMFSEWCNDPTDCIGGKRIGTRPSLWDEDFKDIIAIARHDIPREYDDCDRQSIERYLTLALQRLRSGFRKAHARFESKGRFYAPDMFRTIRDSVNSAVRCIEYEGQEFILSYGNGDARCSAVEYDYYD